MRQNFIEVEQVEKHVRIRCGQTTFHSEEYFDEATARRAARLFVKAVNERPMRLAVWSRGERVVTQVRKVWASGGGKTVVLPVDGGPDQARPPYSDPALETAGM